MNKKIFILILLFLLCIVGCEYGGNNKKLIFGNTDDTKLTKIYELSGGGIVYSEFNSIDYTDSRVDLISLSKALKEKRITIEEILDKSQVVSPANDGGSILYTFMASENDISDSDFYVIECKKNDEGKSNIIFGSQNVAIHGCSIPH